MSLGIRRGAACGVASAGRWRWWWGAGRGVACTGHSCSSVLAEPVVHDCCAREPVVHGGGRGLDIPEVVAMVTVIDWRRGSGSAPPPPPQPESVPGSASPRRHPRPPSPEAVMALGAPWPSYRSFTPSGKSPPLEQCRGLPSPSQGAVPRGHGAIHSSSFLLLPPPRADPAPAGGHSTGRSVLFLLAQWRRWWSGGGEVEGVRRPRRTGGGRGRDPVPD